MGSIIVVYDKNAESVSYRLNDIINKHKKYKDEFQVVRWDEKTWRNNRVTSQGELSGIIIFLGKIQGVNEIIKVSDVVFNEHYVTCYKSGNYLVISAKSNLLRKSKEKYDSFINDLNKIADNRIKKANHGFAKVKAFMKNGIREMKMERDNIETQQLLYGATMIVNQGILDSYLAGDKYD